MFKVGKKYKVRDLDYFAKHPRDFSFDDGEISSCLAGTSHFMTSSMLRKKEVTIVNIMKNAFYTDFITIEEDGFVWEPWMLVPSSNTIMETE